MPHAPSRTRSTVAIALLSLTSAPSCRQTSPPAPSAVRLRDAAPPVRDGGVAQVRAPGRDLPAFESRDALVAWLDAPIRPPGSASTPGDAAIGDAFGFGGLGATGTGEGGGGTGSGTIGLGNIGTIGHGAGTGSGQGYGSGAGRGMTSASTSAPSPSPSRARASSAGSAGSAAGSTTSITNNQEEGVDEGDIVKVHGEHLVVLRRGRLFTVAVGEARIRPVAMIDAFPPGATPASWYDEMLVHGDTVIVLGYDYRARATEVNRFTIDPQGAMRFLDSYQVRASDYYSSRNYASRVIGNRLVLYAPLTLRSYGSNTISLPAVRRRGDADWTEVAALSRVYRPAFERNRFAMLHTVTTCTLGTGALQCSAIGVVGPRSRSFYVSEGAVYLWLTEFPGYRTGRGYGTGPSESALYRLPFGDQPAGLVRTHGAPTDQLSFRETEGELQVLVRADGRGDAMWSSEQTGSSSMALLRVPLSRLRGDSGRAEETMYRALPAPDGQGALQNRFVGGSVLYGQQGYSWGAARPREGEVWAHAIASGETTRLPLAHVSERIEPMGTDAVVVGTGGTDLHFSAISLADRPTIAGSYVQRGAQQGESRTHGFFYLPQGERRGVLGLPTLSEDAEGSEDGRGRASVLFLSVDALQFHSLGALATQRSTGASRSDGCRASCVDWYGNARPIFYGDRVFALMGYELVEGRIADGRISTVGRVDYLQALRR